MMKHLVQYADDTCVISNYHYLKSSTSKVDVAISELYDWFPQINN